MKASELRIGNKVNYFSESADRWFDNHEVTALDIECLDLDRGDHADGIPLTEKRFISLGFEKITGIEIPGYRIKPKNGPLPFMIFFDEPLYRYGFDQAETHCFKHFQYVHHLQNLYFVITGEELKER